MPDTTTSLLLLAHVYHDPAFSYVAASFYGVKRRISRTTAKVRTSKPRATSHSSRVSKRLPLFQRWKHYRRLVKNQCFLRHAGKFNLAIPALIMGKGRRLIIAQKGIHKSIVMLMPMASSYHIIIHIIINIYDMGCNKY